MFESVKAGKIIFEESGDTLSDGTSGGIEDGSVSSYINIPNIQEINGLGMFAKL